MLMRVPSSIHSTVNIYNYDHKLMLVPGNEAYYYSDGNLLEYSSSDWQCVWVCVALCDSVCVALCAWTSLE